MKPSTAVISRSSFLPRSLRLKIIRSFWRRPTTAMKISIIEDKLLRNDSKRLRRRRSKPRRNKLELASKWHLMEFNDRHLESQGCRVPVVAYMVLIEKLNSHLHLQTKIRLNNKHQHNRSTKRRIILMWNLRVSKVSNP